jgi:sporulation protein YlmC with PRC-barrel domain
MARNHTSTIDEKPVLATKKYRRVMSASTLTGDKVVNPDGETLGKIDEIMIDTISGRVAYAVLSFGGFLGAGDKLFAIPWDQLSLDEDNKQFVLDMNTEKLKQAPGFDKNNWPDMADTDWSSRIYSYYGSSLSEE